MNAYLRAASAIGPILILAACTASTAGLKPNAAASQALTPNPACLSQTGDRITPQDGTCSQFGRSYSSRQINQTGAATTGEALQRLDPSITVHH